MSELLPDIKHEFIRCVAGAPVDKARFERLIQRIKESEASTVSETETTEPLCKVCNQPEFPFCARGDCPLPDGRTTSEALLATQSARLHPPEATEGATPRTDAESIYATHQFPDGSGFLQGNMVLADFARELERENADLRHDIERYVAIASAEASRSATRRIDSSEAALLPGLREALKWKPNTPQLENAMTYAWESAIKSFVRALEEATPTTTTAPEEKTPRWIVRAGDSDWNTWMCATRDDVRKAIAEAMFGSVEDSAEHQDEWDKYMAWFDDPEEWDNHSGREIGMNFEDGSLEIIALHRPRMNGVRR